MYVAAISIGYAVPDSDFNASVHSAFQSALNLRVKEEIGLLTLITSRDGDHPQGIRLDTPKDFSFEQFQTGEPVLCKDGILHFESNSLTVRLSGAQRWKCDLPTLEFDPTNPAVSAAWSFVWDVLNKRLRHHQAVIIAEELFRSTDSTQAGVPRKVRAAMRGLIAATRQYELTDTSFVDSLIGLGPGLTPSGDDLLVGYMAGLWCTIKNHSERAQFISSLAETIIQLSHKTNDISRTYLYHAVGGQVSSRLADLASSICRGDDPGILREIADTAMSVGHTSGMEVVTGLLMGLTAWEGNHLFPM